MLRRLDRAIRGLGMAFAIVLSLAFAAPAFASHVCADSPACAASDLAIIQADADPDAGCADCGPACANGCCHAPHAATAPEHLVPTTGSRFVLARAWFDQTRQPLDRPAGPERPPRA